MGFLNTECPKCGDEGAFYNGVKYECPNCEYTCNEIEDDIESEE